jgi:hypothetical protein
MNNIVKKSKKKLKRIKAPTKYRSNYRSTYDELYTLTDSKLEWYIANGFPEEQDMARGIREKRKRDRLLTYGY